MNLIKKLIAKLFKKDTNPFKGVITVDEARHIMSGNFASSNWKLTGDGTYTSSGIPLTSGYWNTTSAPQGNFTSTFSSKIHCCCCKCFDKRDDNPDDGI